MIWLRHPMLSVFCRLAVGLAFAWAGILKVADPAAFADGLVNYRMFPPWSIPTIAVTVPAIEVVAGLALLLGLVIRGAALVTAWMMSVFTIAIVQAIARGINIECGCFGAGSGAAGTIGWPEVVRDLALLGASLQVVLYDKGLLSLQRLRARMATRR